MSDAALRRRHVIARIIELAKMVRDPEGRQKYDVRRGAIDWESYTWPKNHAVAVRAPENFPRVPTVNGRRSTIEFVVACRVPAEEESSLADDELDVMEEDMIVVMHGLSQSQSPFDADCIVIGAPEFEGSIEFFDADLKVQGYQVLFTVIY